MKKLFYVLISFLLTINYCFAQLNQDIYLFWQQYLQQTNRTGSILDPLPASLIGNIHNATDSNDVALGYFETSAVRSTYSHIESQSK
jgi:hypothetical protein